MVEAGKAGVTLETVGRFGGDVVSLGGVAAPLAALSELYRNSFAQKVT